MLGWGIGVNFLKNYAILFTALWILVLFDIPNCHILSSGLVLGLVHWTIVSSVGGTEINRKLEFRSSGYPRCGKECRNFGFCVCAAPSYCWTPLRVCCVCLSRFPCWEASTRMHFCKELKHDAHEELVYGSLDLYQCLFLKITIVFQRS